MVTGTKYLLDSDIVIAMLRDGKDVSGLRRKALSVGLDNCYISAISLSELYLGAYRMQSERGLHEVAFIKAILNILPFQGPDASAAEGFGRIGAMLTSAGKPLDDMDLLIGVSALAEGMTMVTHNTRHFSRIPGLTLEDWLA